MSSSKKIVLSFMFLYIAGVCGIGVRANWIAINDGYQFINSKEFAILSDNFNKHYWYGLSRTIYLIMVECIANLLLLLTALTLLIIRHRLFPNVFMLTLFCVLGGNALDYISLTNLGKPPMELSYEMAELIVRSYTEVR